MGTGLNADPRFGELVARKTGQETGKPFVTAVNKFAAVITKYWSTAESLKNSRWRGGPPNIVFSPIWCPLDATGAFDQA